MCAREVAWLGSKPHVLNILWLSSVSACCIGLGKNGVSESQFWFKHKLVHVFRHINLDIFDFMLKSSVILIDTQIICSIFLLTLYFVPHVEFIEFYFLAFLFDRWTWESGQRRKTPESVSLFSNIKPCTVYIFLGSFLANEPGKSMSLYNRDRFRKWKKHLLVLTG